MAIHGPRKAKPGEEGGAEVFVISVAAELAGMHAQTLRTYDRMGLVTPRRTRGGGRRYSRRDVALLRKIQKLSQEDGVNLAGIKEILRLTEANHGLQAELEDAQAENEELKARVQRAKAEAAAARSRASASGVRPRGEIVHVPRSTAVVMWEPRARARRHGHD